MKKIYLYIIVITIGIIFLPKSVFAYNENKNETEVVDLNSILDEEKENFGIKDFIKAAESYSPDFIKDLNISNVFDMALSGKVDNKNILSKIANLFGSEIKGTLKILINILLIVLIHSILKSITEGLENSNVSKIVYYVQYILIVTIIMSNFSNILKDVKDTIENLVGFSETLVPLLITLMAYTGNITTTAVIEPILLFLIEFIANIIKNLIIPIISIITVLVIISKITNRVQINKLSGFFKSSIVWFLGVVLTLFIGVLSLEGSLTSSIDGVTAKTTKAAVSSLIPIVRKNFRRWCRCNFRMWCNFKKCSWNCRSNYNNRNMYFTNYKAFNI
mgnify:FL=1|jgi:stage III sporulation protein AE